MADYVSIINGPQTNIYLYIASWGLPSPGGFIMMVGRFNMFIILSATSFTITVMSLLDLTIHHHKERIHTLERILFI